MSKIFIKRTKSKDVNEDITQQTNQPVQQQVQPTSTAANPKIEESRAKILQLQSQLQQAEQDFNNKKSNIQKQIVLLNQIIVSKGGNPVVTEATHSNYYSKLWESANDNDTIELLNVIKDVFINLDELSYYPSDKECMNFTRKILPVLNKKWNDGKEHWSEIYDDIIDKFKTAPLSTRELNDVVSEFKILLKEHPNFKYIFGL